MTPPRPRPQPPPIKPRPFSSPALLRSFLLNCPHPGHARKPRPFSSPAPSPAPLPYLQLPRWGRGPPWAEGAGPDPGGRSLQRCKPIPVRGRGRGRGLLRGKWRPGQDPPSWAGPEGAGPARTRPRGRGQAENLGLQEGQRSRGEPKKNQTHGTPKNSKITPKSSEKLQNHPKITLRDPKITKKLSKSPQRTPKSPQNPPQTTPRDPKTIQKNPQIPPNPAPKPP